MPRISPLRRLLSTAAPTPTTAPPMYEYTGPKRWSGLTKGVGGVAVYMLAKTAFQHYTGVQTQLAMYADQFSLSPFEVAAFAFVLSQQAIYLRKLVYRMDVSGDLVTFQTYNFVGLPSRKVHTYDVRAMDLTTAEDKLFLKPLASKKRHEYYILHGRHAKIEQLFSPYETF